MKLEQDMIKKYHKPVPRYTSYPTVPYWENNLDEEKWESLVQLAFNEFGINEGISLYIHLPFCESLSTYCRCDNRITKNHKVESQYIEAILREWEHYLGILGEDPKISSIHLGGGIPTFFSPDALNFLLSKILKSAESTTTREFSFEGHPHYTTFEHLQVLSSLGFDRISYRIQDFNELAQSENHRIQPFEKVKEATENARKTGYQSINFDLIYGLPYQTLDTLKDTLQKVAILHPERIAFYSYAHLPRSFPAQKTHEAFLPNEHLKRALYELGKEKLIQMGYEEIGMEHFALPQDPLSLAKKDGKLHRNFMGYTTITSKMILGLGADSISDVWYGFSQNEKNIELYQSTLIHHQLPINKGHKLSQEDIKVRQLILNLICIGEANIPYMVWEKLSRKNLNNLKEMDKLGLIQSDLLKIKITDKGRAMVRNICSQFDLRMNWKQVLNPSFSQSI
jgi:oxygen-independent coproporphyrinogen III oxidase